ncbi:MAG: DPP IV N-terminal domain-containing protein [Planctomycetota bacterium]|nr:DPP IV N-terminal domain-containing protein [Planctomycetota bacterium]
MSNQFVPHLLLALIPALLTVAEAQGRRGKQSQNPGARWAHDGKHVVLNDTWRSANTWTKVKAVPARRSKPKPDSSAADFADALSIERVKKTTTRDLRAVRVRTTIPRTATPKQGSRTSGDKKTSAIILDGRLWVQRTGSKIREVVAGLGETRHFGMAPDGSALSYILDNDIYIVGTKDGKPRRITTDGGVDTFNGELDWVYQEEVYGRGEFKANWWSPAGGYLAYMRIDEKGVDTFRVIDHIDDQLVVEDIKYPKSGRINPRATLHVAAASNGKVVAVDLSKYSKKDEILIVRVGWSPKGKQVVYMVQDREQTWLDLNFADPATGKSRTVIREHSDDSWIERLPMPKWLKDGSFIWESDRTGYRHYYRYRVDGVGTALSKGPWSAQEIIRIDEPRNSLAFYGNTKNYSIGRHAYVVSLDGKSQKCVTKGRGHHSVSFNKAGTMVIDTFNHLANAGEQWLRSVEGKDITKTWSADTPNTSGLPQWHQIKARDGFLLDVTYTLPKDFDPKQKYPVWINTYSGPAAPTVSDRFRGASRPPSPLIQFQVNVRSATKAGMHATKACYKQFGVQELKDIEDAIDWLCDNAWADASRVGMSGFSYGGFMTAYAMTHSDKIKCGVAGSGVYDWRLYDTIYTERYMQTPQNNPAGYDISSVVKAAKNLKGQLLITHGTMDDNVHLQNAIQLVYALQKAGKMNFEFMPYARSRHGFSPSVRRHYMMLSQRFMREKL